MILTMLSHRAIWTGGVVGLWALMAAVNSESVLTLAALGAGAATAVIWIWRAPQSTQLKAEIESHTMQLAAWEKRLQESEHCIDEMREKLRASREALVEAGLRIRELEESKKANHAATGEA